MRTTWRTSGSCSSRCRGSSSCRCSARPRRRAPPPWRPCAAPRRPTPPAGSSSCTASGGAPAPTTSAARSRASASSRTAASSPTSSRADPRATASSSSAADALRSAPSAAPSSKSEVVLLSATSPPQVLHLQHLSLRTLAPTPMQATIPTPTLNMPRKIFVGNVHADVDVDRLYEYFAQFGEIEEGPLGFDKNTGKPKGFALFVYKSVESARRALEEPLRNFDGKMLNVQKAIDGRTKGSSGTSANANSNTTTASAAAAAAAAAAQMTAPVTSAISPYDASGYGTTAVTDLGFAQQAAMLGLGAQQQAFAQPNAMLAMIAAMQNPAALGMTPAMLAAMNPAFAAAALGAGGQQAHTAGLTGFGAQGFGTQAFGAGGAAFPNAAGVQAAAAAAAYQGAGAPPGFQGPPGFQVGQATTQTSTAAAAAAGAAGYQAGAAGQSQVPGAQIGGTGFQGGY
ncbi:hypothetical protein HU200_063559 [Digitaria exilis]|uniref:RRM domain-containing protein n=1 Tax=Digitaria exilis TaxID=1010633 RepID=A0A835A5U3_9POAL|nr:hypothetical protein HU200_063559 [Digitaria exilis]